MTIRKRLADWLLPRPEHDSAAALAAGVIDDERLTELARSRPEPLVPVLRQASLMRPLIVLLAVLSPMVAFEYRPLTYRGAVWSLRALQAYGARSVTDFLDPVEAEAPVQSHGRPALISWLTAGGMWLTSPGRNGSRSAVALASTIGLIFAASVAARRLGGDRLSLVVAVVLAFQAPLFAFAQQPTPDGLTLMLVMLSLSCWQRHLAASERPFTWWLPVTVICLGGTLMSGGAIGLVVLLVLLGTLAAVRSLRRDPDEAHGLLDALVLILAGIPLGMWWIGWISFRQGTEAWVGWFTLGPWESASGAAANLASAWGMLWRDAGPWTVLAMTGVIASAASIPSARRANVDQTAGSISLLFLGGISLALWTVMVLQGPDQVGRPWFSLVQLVLWLLAAVGILAVAERRLPFPASLLALVAATGELMAHWFLTADQAPHRLGLGLIVAGCLLVLLGLVMWAGEHDSRRRAILAGLLAFTTTGGLWLGAAQMPRATAADAQLQSVRLSLLGIPDAQSCVLITTELLKEDAFGAARRHYLLRSIWPHLDVREFDDKHPPPPEAARTGTEVMILWGTRAFLPGPEYTLLHNHNDRNMEVAVYVRRTAEAPSNASPDL